MVLLLEGLVMPAGGMRGVRAFLYALGVVFYVARVPRVCEWAELCHLFQPALMPLVRCSLLAAQQACEQGQPPKLVPVTHQGQEVGAFGIVHPEVLEKFDVPYPVSALELNLEPFCYDQFYRSLLTSSS